MTVDCRLLDRRTLLLAAAAGGALIALPGAPALAQESPEAVMRRFFDTLLDAMRNGPQLGFRGRYDRIKPAFEAAFDVPFMTRVVVGSSWGGLPADTQKRLIDAFTRFSVSSYARSFRKFDGERFDVKGTQQYPQGTLVLADIVPQGEKPIALNHLMRQDEAKRWRAFDVFLDGTISQLATRRSDFASTLRDRGPDGLIQELDAKSKGLEEGA